MRAGETTGLVEGKGLVGGSEVERFIEVKEGEGNNGGAEVEGLAVVASLDVLLDGEGSVGKVSKETSGQDLCQGVRVGMAEEKG